MEPHRLHGLRGVVIFVIAVGLLIALWGRPVPPGPRPPQPPEARRTRVPTVVVLTRVPAPVPIPTISPLLVTRSGVAAPSAPEVLVAASQVVNVACVGDCTYPGAASWVTSDTQVGWTHADPLDVDYYEVWRSRMEPYFDPTACAHCDLVGTTTGLEFVVPDAPLGFNPVGGTVGASIQSDLTFFRVRAVNAGGASSVSNEIGAVTYSLLQGMQNAPH